MSREAEIRLQIKLDEDKIPQEIQWEATDSADGIRKADAFLLSLWDPSEKNSLKIDLWTKDMMVHDMDHLFFQTFMNLAETYKKATGKNDLAERIRDFAIDFGDAAFPDEKGEG